MTSQYQHCNVIHLQCFQVRYFENAYPESCIYYIQYFFGFAMGARNVSTFLEDITIKQTVNPKLTLNFSHNTDVLVTVADHHIFICHRWCSCTWYCGCGVYMLDRSCWPWSRCDWTDILLWMFGCTWTHWKIFYLLLICEWTQCHQYNTQKGYNLKQI